MTRQEQLNKALINSGVSVKSRTGAIEILSPKSATHKIHRAWFEYDKNNVAVLVVEVD